MGTHCELKLDLCANISCKNNGICKTIDLAWKCICLDPTLYYGNYCERQTSALAVKKSLTKSFASVAITALVLTCSFVIVMDILKYLFHIDPAKEARMKRAKAKRTAPKRKSGAPKVAVRFQYVS